MQSVQSEYSYATPDWIQLSIFHFSGTGKPKCCLRVISRVSSGDASFCLSIEWSWSHTCWLNPMFLSSTFSSQANTSEGITLWVCSERVLTQHSFPQSTFWCLDQSRVSFGLCSGGAGAYQSLSNSFSDCVIIPFEFLQPLSYHSPVGSLVP